MRRFLKCLPGPKAAVIFTLAAYLVSPLKGQVMLEVAEKQMERGLAIDARVLVDGILKSGAGTGAKEKALYYQAALTEEGGKALDRLENIAGSGENDSLAAAALERLGDLAFSEGRYIDASRLWNQAALKPGVLETEQRVLVKAARAQLRINRPQGALSALRKALETGEGPHTGMIRYWRGIAKQAVGDSEGAASEYMIAYKRAADPYQHASLYRLCQLYGRGSSSTAAMWRKRWRDTSHLTVFDSRFLAPLQEPSYSIQLGAFSTLTRAQSLVERVRKLGLDPVVIPAGPDGLFRVRITGLPSKREVERMVSLLKKNRLEYRVISPGGK